MEECAELATGRRHSLFADDFEASRGLLESRFAGRRIAVVGGGGSIGNAVVRALLGFRVGCLSVIDPNENSLVELVRDLRSSPGLAVCKEFAAVPIRMGTTGFDRYMADNGPFDYVFNLAAVKHVRSEKDVYSIMHMVDTNVLFVEDLVRWCSGEGARLFSVSSDKAVNPANIMGATKRVMEQVLFAIGAECTSATARFANVAFSEGSLLFGFLKRIEKRQPLSAPCDIRRYFISHQEAGELCLLAAGVGNGGEIFIPEMEGCGKGISFAEIGERLLERIGYEPVLCRTEEEARGRAAELTAEGKWPCHFFESDTSGEKEIEEFVREGETVDWSRFRRVGVIRERGGAGGEALRGFLEFARGAQDRSDLSKQDYVAALQRVVPEFQHVERGRSLDERM